MLKYLTNSVSPSSFFVGAALLFELVLNIVSPPLVAPDEFNHFYRAYQVSEGNFFPLKQNKRLGGYIPNGVSNFADHYRQCDNIKNYTLTFGEMLNAFQVERDETPRFHDFANTAYYSPVSYAPQALALFFLRACHAPPAALYYGGRLFVFFVWLFCMYQVIKLLPVFRWLFTVLFLLPMNLYMASTYSADTVTNILSFLFIALTFRHIFVTERITCRQVLILGLLLVLLALAKVVYIGLAILVLAIPGRKFQSSAYRWGSLALLLLLSGLPALAWSTVVMKFYIPYREYDPAYTYDATISACADYYVQKEYILSHGFYFLKVIYRSLFDHPYSYLSGYIGVFAHLDVVLPKWLYGLSYGIILVVAFTEKNNFRWNVWQRLILLAAIGLSLAALLLSQHLMWDCIGIGIVDLLQGRYLIPLFPLLFVVLGTSYRKKTLYSGLLIIPFIIGLNVYGFYVIYHRFFVGRPCQKTEFSCNVEEIDNQGFYKTTNSDILLSGAYSRVGEEHRSGSHSALLSPVAPFCFTYKFKGLHKGDLIEAEAWEKGEGVLLVVSGKQKNCAEVYFGGCYKSARDRKGWLRIKNVYFYDLNCDSMEMAFYAWNPGKTNVYLDDIRFTVKRFKK